MTELLFQIGIFVLAIFVLVKAADHFTESAEKIGVWMKIPPFIVGVTLVAIGTSLPELVTSLIAVFAGKSEIVVATVVGSNITNIFLVLGITAIISKKLTITYQLIKVDLPLITGSAFLLGAMLWDGQFHFIEGLICIAGFVIYMFYTITTQDHRVAASTKEEVQKIKRKVKKEKEHKLSWKNPLIFFFSAIFIYLGAKYTISSVIEISKIIGIGIDIISVSAVALGTSLPELVVALKAASKGNSEMAIGNVLGSNIFNTFAVMGISAMFGTLIIPASILTFALPIMIMATLLFFFTTQDNMITRWEGWMLFLFYIFFISKLFF